MKDFFKNTSYFGQLAYFLLMIGASLALAIVVMIPFSMQNIEGEALIKSKLLIQGISQLIMFLLPALLFAWIFYNNIGEFFQMSFSKDKLLLTLLGCLAMIASIPMVDFLTTWNDGIHLPESMQQFETIARSQAKMSNQLVNDFLSLSGIGMLLANILIMAIIPAFCEELIFRGVLQQLLIKWFKRPHLSIILVAAIFSLTHFDLFCFVPRFVLGIILGYIFYYSRTIWASFFAHFLNNATIVVMTYLHLTTNTVVDPQNINLPNSLVWAIASLFLSVLIIYTIAKKSKKDLEKNENLI